MTSPGEDRLGGLHGAEGVPSERWLSRLRGNFRLTIISLFGLCAMAGILPFAVLRFMDGDLVTAIGDCLLVAILAAIVAYAWKSGRTVIAGALAALVMTAGFLLLVTFGNVSVFWAYPLLASSFLLTSRYLALLACLAMLGVLGFQAHQFASMMELWGFLVTGSLVAIFGLIFATRTEMQRAQLAEIAVRDPLTGAGNRRALRSHVDALDALPDKEQRPTSLVLMDIDRFKIINDRHGHDEGDRVLVDLVALVHGAVREQDRIYRLGGEEFVLILQDTDRSGLRQVVEKVHAALRENLRGPDGPITVSMGAATRRHGEPAQEWLLRADKAMYRAKRGGRDRAIYADSMRAGARSEEDENRPLAEGNES